jgi:hypothetical protein
LDVLAPGETDDAGLHYDIVLEDESNQSQLYS